MRNRQVCKLWKNFIDEQKFTWIRIIERVSLYERFNTPEKCYTDQHSEFENHNCHSEINAWRTIVKEGKFEIVKELGIGVRRFYVLNDGYTKITKGQLISE